MSETPELPPLPGPAYGWFSDYYDGWSYTENPTDRWQDMLLFTEEQVSAYGRECWDAGRRAGLEEAAKLCESKGYAQQPVQTGSPLLIGAELAVALRGGECGGTGRAKP